MSQEQDPDDKNSKLSGLIKKAVTIGASAYAIGEDTLNKTLSTVQLPKEWFKESVEKLFDAYTITVNAEIKLTPKKRVEENKNEST